MGARLGKKQYVINNVANLYSETVMKYDYIFLNLLGCSNALGKSAKSSGNLSNSSGVEHRRSDIESRGFSIGARISKTWALASKIGETRIRDRRPGL